MKHKRDHGFAKHRGPLSYGPKKSKMGSLWHPKFLKMPQDASKMPQHSLKTLQDGPKTIQDPPRIPQDAPQDAPQDCSTCKLLVSSTVYVHVP